MRKLLFLILCSLNYFLAYGQWCCIDTNFIIKDLSTGTLRFQISGAVNNDLASSSQGLCGVRLKFKHKFLGDLTMSLISPSGQKIDLVGPNGSKGITDLTTWNVSFVPCASTAVPDVGFKPKWDNLQNWGILGKFYNGTYYPFNGCLEDFNTGAVNGIWSLNITDAAMFYDGVLESFCLLFCDQNGVSCNSCSANGGYFNNSAIKFCEGNPMLNLVNKPTLPSFTPDPASYGYKYLIFQNNILTEIKDDLDFRSYPVGDYTICGISYLLSDFSKIPAAGISFNQIKNDFASNKYNACAELSKDCLNLSILPISTANSVTASICNGGVYSIGGKDYSQAGNYKINLLNIYGCDSIVDLTLSVVNLDANIVLPVGELSCTTKTITLDARNSKVNANTIINWETNGGYFDDLTNKLLPIISKAGTYKLLLIEGNCRDSVEVNVINTSVIPSIKIQSDTITCDKPSVTISAITNAINPTFRWEFNGVDIGTNQNINVSVAGIYTVEVTDFRSCSNKETYTVVENKSKPDFTPTATHINCKVDTAVLDFSSNSSYKSFFWSGPNNFQSLNKQSFTTLPGIYQLVVVGENGCSETKTVEVISDIKTLSVSFKVDSLTCNKKSVQINSNFNGQYTFDWSGPNNFKSNLASTTVDLAGRYFVTIVDENSCSLDTFVDVFENTVPPNYKLSASILACNPDSIQIILNFNGSANFNDYNYYWSGPIGFGSDQASPWVKEEGFYTVRVIGLNGCISMDTITIFQTKEKPKINLSAKELSCLDSSVLIQINSPTAISFQTSGPLGFYSNSAQPLATSPGKYKVVVTDANGCTAEKSIIIVENRTPPFDVIQAESKNCVRDSVVLSFSTSSLIDSVLWTGPNGFLSNNISPKVLDFGFYILQAKGRNGCVLSDTIEVVYDTTKPIITIITDTLSCSKSEFSLQKNANIIIDKYIWTSPSGKVDTSLNYQISIPGFYTVRAIGLNGCESTSSFNIVQVSTKPKVVLSSDTITCTQPTVNINPIATDSSLVYIWTGPNNFFNTSKSITVSEAGKYLLNIQNRFGCTANDSIEIFSTVKTPTFVLSDYNFNCSNINRNVIKASPAYAGISFEWTFPNSIKQIADSITILQVGTYIISATDVNQCKFVDTIQVTIDTTRPVIDLISSDTINCFKSKITLFAESKDAAKYQWTGPNGFSSSLQNPIIDNPGNYTVAITGLNFCTSSKSIEIIADTKIPDINAVAQNIDCANTRGGVNVISADSIIVFSWTTPSGVIVNQKSFSTFETGLYSVIVEGKNRCLAVDSVLLVIDTFPPLVKGSYDLFPCNADSTQIFANSNSKIKDYFWIGPNRFFSTEASPFIRDTGIYEIIVLGDNNCQSKSIIHVDGKKDYPSLLTKSATLSCKHDTVQIYSIFNNIDSLISWRGPSGFFNNKDRNPYVSNSGDYTISIINKKGCQVDSIVHVDIDTIKPVFTLNQLDSLQCENNSVRLTASLSSQGSFQYKWTSSSNSNFNSSQSIKDVIINSAGIYNLVVTDDKNGCTNIASIEVIERKNNIVGIDIDVSQISCFTQSDASIKMNSIFGGQAPYFYSIDGINFNGNSTISQLKPGTYNLFVKDKNGCKYDTLVQINEGFILNLDLGQDTSIQLGESYTIEPQTNGDSLRLTLRWLPTSEIYCDECFAQTVSPLQSTLYKLRITDENGCTAEDDIYIKVNTKPKIFIPNVFTPNGDQLNDLISLSAGIEVEEISSIRIFDRWGELVHEEENYALGSQEFIKWDGTLDGKLCLPGVYVYMVKAKLINGKNHIFTGDITLMR